MSEGLNISGLGSDILDIVAQYIISRDRGSSKAGTVGHGMREVIFQHRNYKVYSGMKTLRSTRERVQIGLAEVSCRLT